MDTLALVGREGAGGLGRAGLAAWWGRSVLGGRVASVCLGCSLLEYFGAVCLEKE